MKPNDFSESRVLVTGGAGFIGSALIWALNRRGCDNIVVCDILGTNEKWRNFTPLRFADYVEAADLLPRLQSNALGKFDLVLHLGACSATTEKDATYLIKNNYEFTKDLAVWSLAQKTRFVYASSAATYGDGSEGMEDNETKLDTLRPLNMYGYSKHLFDLHAKRAGFLNKIVGLKYFNVFGPNEDHKGDMRSLVHKSFSQLKTEGVIRLFKSYRKDFRDGEQKRDFLYVKDAVAMTLHLAATLKAVISQRLVRNLKGGRSAAVEVLLNTRYTAELIDKGEISEIKDAMEKSMTPGSQTFEQALFKMYRDGIISKEEALGNADSATNLMWLMNQSESDGGAATAAAGQKKPEKASDPLETTTSFSEFKILADEKTQ